jgi:arginine:pyruvate transaminase
MRSSSPASLPGMAERMATINNLSKSHTMSGWRVGWVIGPKLLSEHLVNVVFMLFGIPDFTQNDA